MSNAVPSASAPQFRVVAAIVLIALVGLTAFAIQIVVAQKQFGVYGWNIGPDGKTIISVTPGYPAARAGVQEGDTIDFATLPLLGRINLYVPSGVYGGAPLTFRFTHDGRQRMTTMIATPTRGFFTSNIIGVASGLLVITIGIWLVLLRPSRMTWGLLLVGLGAVAGDVTYPWGNLWIYFTSAMFVFVGGAFEWMGLLMFASRFPTNAPKSWLTTLDRAAVPAGVLFLALTAYVGADLLFSSTPPAHAVLITTSYAYPALVTLTVLAALISSAVTARGSDRQRLLPVIATFAIWTTLFAMVLILGSLFTTPFAIYIVPFLASIALAIFFVAVAYGIIRHRVIDVGFIISRTLAYTILTGILVGVFTLIDFLVGTWLASSRLALVFEIGAAIFVGVWLNAMHSRVDRFVDSVLFRRRHLAEKRLVRVAKALPHATSMAFVDDALVVEPEGALELASSALFRRRPDNRFERCKSIGWNAASANVLDQSDPLVTHLRAELDSVNISDVRWSRNDIPLGLYQPLLAVPVVVRHRLEAFALYSGHVGGEALDPDEIRSLRELAVPAGAIYDHLEAESLRDQLEALRTANAELRHEQQINANALDLMRRQMAAIDELLSDRRPSKET